MVTHRPLLKAAAVSASLALVLCIIMTVHSLQGNGLAGCAPGSSCDQVLGGRWSMLLGVIPVSALAAGVYLAVLVSLAVVLFGSDEEVRRLAGRILVALAGAIVGSAVWFIGLQVFSEGTLCKYCMAAHGMGLITAVLVLCSLLPGIKRGVPYLVTGLGLAALLALGQALTVPDSVYQAGVNEEPLPLIGPGDFPLVGSPDAPYIIDLLYDYQCSHCQHLHGLLDEVVGRFDGRVAFVLCPCPLSPRCNPYVPREELRFNGSCEMASLALALHRISPALFKDFDAWMYAGNGTGSWRPRSVDDARSYAETLAGAEPLDDALSEVAASGLLAQSAELFGRTAFKSYGAIPRFVCRDRWVVPEVTDAGVLSEVLASELGIE